MINFHFRSDMKGLEDSAVGNTIFQVIINQQRKIESHAVPGHGIAWVCFLKIARKEARMMGLSDYLNKIGLSIAELGCSGIH